MKQSKKKQVGQTRRRLIENAGVVSKAEPEVLAAALQRPPLGPHGAIGQLAYRVMDPAYSQNKRLVDIHKAKYQIPPGPYEDEDLILMLIRAEQRAKTQQRARNGRVTKGRPVGSRVWTDYLLGLLLADMDALRQRGIPKKTAAYTLSLTPAWGPGDLCVLKNAATPSTLTRRLLEAKTNVAAKEFGKLVAQVRERSSDDQWAHFVSNAYVRFR